MKITKYLHSCLLFEKEGFKLLFDPGKFSFSEGLVRPEQFSGVDAVVITHHHPDHLDTEKLQQIFELSGAKIYTNKEVAKDLADLQLNCELVDTGERTIGPFRLKVIKVKHEAILDSPLPDMQAYVIDGRVLNPADSFGDHYAGLDGIELLILPVMAPFTTEIAVAAFADRIRPKAILPVHDGYAKDFFLQQRYDTYQQHFKQQGIAFHLAAQPGFTLIL